ncbi:sialate O-acetylesterase-like [Paramacrobiotus metropolitanus]|uniref:sialate O-acetylesterase-like n=1 Tax=Paramacrobiotus metropolitanus TaxID=2943436 RepID=UPI00244587F8|nr:sialate O-acetylesterase-like [Paramacrobiotus metropolitanus]
MPIGLIGAYRDKNSPIRGWIPSESIAQCEDTVPLSDSTGHRQTDDNQTDSTIWNAMIAPLKRLRLTSVIWYQGESDAALQPDLYGCLLQAMVNGWRNNFYRGVSLPFGIVQLGTRNFDDVQGATPLLRWEQTAEYGQVPNEALVRVFMASAIDLPDPESPFGSHVPRYKEEIAKRLLAGVLSVLYYRHIPFQGPFPQRTYLVKDDVFIEYDQDFNFMNVVENFEVCSR